MPTTLSLGGFEEALAFARESASETLSKVPLDRWRAMTVPEFVVDFHPEIKAIVPSTPESTIYEVSDRLALSISVMSGEDPDFFDVATLICSANIWNGAPVPNRLQTFAYSVLTDKKKRPRKRGPKSGKDFILRMILRKFAQDLEMLFDIELTRNESSPPESACDIVVHVAKENGYFVEYNTVRDWCQNPKYSRFREQADGLIALLTDTYLINLGALKPRM